MDLIKDHRCNGTLSSVLHKEPPATQGAESHDDEAGEGEGPMLGVFLAEFFKLSNGFLHSDV